MTRIQASPVVRFLSRMQTVLLDRQLVPLVLTIVFPFPGVLILWSHRSWGIAKGLALSLVGAVAGVVLLFMWAAISATLLFIYVILDVALLFGTISLFSWRLARHVYRVAAYERRWAAPRRAPRLPLPQDESEHAERPHSAPAADPQHARLSTGGDASTPSQAPAATVSGAATNPDVDTLTKQLLDAKKEAAELSQRLQQLERDKRDRDYQLATLTDLSRRLQRLPQSEREAFLSCLSEWLVTVPNLQFRTEIEVEIKFVYPLVTFLGYSDDDLFVRAPTKWAFGSGQLLEGAADWAVYDPSPAQGSRPKFIIEAKKPTVSIDESVQSQARSYAVALGAPYYLVTNGRSIHLYEFALTGDRCILACDARQLPKFWSTLERYIGASSVRTNTMWIALRAKNARKKLLRHSRLSLLELPYESSTSVERAPGDYQGSEGSNFDDATDDAPEGPFLPR